MTTFALALLLQAGPSDAECETFCRKLEEGFRDRDAAALDKALDLDALFEKALRGVPADEKNKAAFVRGAKRSAQVGRKVTQALGESGTLKLLRVRRFEGRPRALFRMLVDDTFNYYEFLLDASPRGGLRIVDLYIALTGEWLSDSMRRLYVSMLASEPGFAGKLVGKENEVLRGMPKLARMNALLEQGKAEEAYRLYDELPAALKAERLAHVQRCRAAQGVGEKEALGALEEFRKAFPGDGAAAIYGLGTYSMAKKWDLALRAMDEIEAWAGGDAYLHCQRALLHLEKGDFAKAKASALRAAAMEKTLDDAYWTLVTISLKEPAYGDTAKWLTVLEKDLKQELLDLTKVEDYAGFVKSPEYREWLKSRGK